MTWWVYILRCGDGTFYCGITVDIHRRLAAHQTGRGARYTKGRGPLELWWSTGPLSHGAALALERRVKRLSHARKESLRGETYL